MMTRLLDFLFPLRSDEEIVRDLTEERFLSFLEPRLIEKTIPETVALFPFAESPVRAVIHEAKYHGNTKAFDLLAAALLDYIKDIDTFIPTEYCLLPIPLGAKRLRKRGYNQAEEVARRIRTFPVNGALLVRTRETTSQVSLPRVLRKSNMQGAFMLRQGALPDPSLTYILLDDVATTGATLQAAIDALAHAGVSHVLPIALAH